MTAPRAPQAEVLAFAFDHRNPFFDLAQRAGAAETRLPTLKRLLVDAVAETAAARELGGSAGILCDDRYGQDALNAATGRGWWIGRPVELPGSNPLQFAAGRRSARRCSRGRPSTSRSASSTSLRTTQSSTGWSRRRRSARSTTPGWAIAA